jgi:outer membrane protein assembly factor BamB
MRAVRLSVPTLIGAASLSALSACSSGSEPVGSGGELPPEARWVVPSALRPTGSLVNVTVATDSIYVVFGVSELVAHRTSDGTVLWKRSDVPTLMPMIVGDSLFVALIGGQSVALRLRDGVVVWRTTVPGGALAIPPAQIGKFALVTNASGDVFVVDLGSGVTRTLATMTSLAGGPGTVWGLLATGDTALVVSQLTSDQASGAITATRVVVGSGAVISRAVLPLVASEFLTAQQQFLLDSLVILPVGGGVTAMNYRTGSRVWSVRSNSVGIAVRNGVIYSGSGSGDITVYDANTGRVMREIRMHGAVAGAILDVYPCREGVFFTSADLWVVPDVAGASPHRVYRDLFSLLSHAGSTLFASAERHELALRCT